MKNKKFMIVDGSSLVHRAFYALPLLTNKEGTFTNAVYGFTTMFLKVLEAEEPEYVVVCFDKKRETFRNRQYKEYKSHRKATPSELKPQFELVKKIVAAMGIKCVEVEDFEADDIIGTLANKAEELGANSIIITGDRDALQLVSDLTHVLLTKKGISQMEEYDLNAIKERYELTPEQLIDLKGLTGDKSDNIPGVPGVGEKTAVKLLKQYSSLEELYENLDDVKGKLQNKLRENKELAFLSKKLATIQTEVPLEFEVKECYWQGMDYERLLQIFKELEFTSLIKRVLDLMQDESGEEPKTEKINDIINIITSSQIEEILSDIPQSEPVGVYVELEDSNYRSAKIKAVGIAHGKFVCAVENSHLDKLNSALNKYFESRKIIAHDAKKNLVALKNYGINLKNIAGDTMIAGYLLDPSLSSHDLPELSLKYLNTAVVENENLHENVASKAKITLRLEESLVSEIYANEMEKLYREVELPLAKILAEMELAGIKVDREELKRMGEELDKGIEELKNTIYDLAGEKFNINSPKQLGKILFEKMDLPVIKKTKTGYSTSAAVLEELANRHPIVEKIVSYRHLTKLKTTYVDGLTKLLTSEDKIHTTFNQTITATGRLSSTEPNLQNIPVRLELGRKLRKVFVPSQDDYCILAADYSQIELRILAHLSQDENLVDAFNKDQDIHTRTASEVFYVDIDSVTKEMRYSAKAVNFGIIYGISEFGLSRDLGISRKEAKEYIEKYYDRHPGVKEYMNRVIADAREKGYVTTILNRRRYLPDLFSPNRNVRNAAERTAMNTPIQGSAADVIKLAMVNVDKIIREKELPVRMLLQVHDELIFEVKREALKDVAKVITREMENAYKLKVPLKVDTKWGPNWYDLKPLKL